MAVIAMNKDQFALGLVVRGEDGELGVEHPGPGLVALASDDDAFIPGRAVAGFGEHQGVSQAAAGDGMAAPPAPAQAAAARLPRQKLNRTCQAFEFYHSFLIS